MSDKIDKDKIDKGVIEFEHLGDPVPFNRPRFNSGRVFNSPRYSQWKKDFSFALKTKYRELVFRDRALYLSATFYRKSSRVVDIDNLLKGLMDAITQSGVIQDDKFIQTVLATKKLDRLNPRVWFQLSAVEWEL